MEEGTFQVISKVRQNFSWRRGCKDKCSRQRSLTRKVGGGGSIVHTKKVSNCKIWVKWVEEAMWMGESRTFTPAGRCRDDSEREGDDTDTD